MEYKKTYSGKNIRCYEVGKYDIIFSPKGWSCTCAGNSAWNKECKHIKLIKENEKNKQI